MRNYETTFIINPQSDDATIEKHVGDIKDIILNSKGKIINENHMGTRRLAYEINKLTQGYYATFLYEAPSDVLPLLEHHFKVNEAYLRDLTVRIECDPKEYMNQQDPFGKYGSDRRDGSSGYQKPNRDSKEVKPEGDAPAVKETSKEETPAVETKSDDSPTEEIKTEEVKAEDKAKDDE